MWLVAAFHPNQEVRVSVGGTNATVPRAFAPEYRYDRDPAEQYIGVFRADTEARANGIARHLANTYPGAKIYRSRVDTIFYARVAEVQETRVTDAGALPA